MELSAAEHGCKMSCTNPVGIAKKDGSPTKRPCGTCIDCRLEYARQWAVRCTHEAQMYDENSFLTLTYNDDNLPDNGSVKKEELQKFMKRLRKEIEPKKVRFFASGEYGKNPITGKINRPHYHICLFNYDFPNKEIFQAKCRKQGHADLLYISPMLSRLWQKGFHTIGEVNFKSAGYTARYITKKHMGRLSEFVYDGIEPEFALMSRGQKKGGKGGIGKPWIDKYWNDCYPKDYVTINGKRHKPPKYYDSQLEKINLHMYQYVMAKRELHAFETLPDSSKRLMEKDRWRKKITQRLERSLECMK